VYELALARLESIGFGIVEALRRVLTVTVFSRETLVFSWTTFDRFEPA